MSDHIIGKNITQEDLARIKQGLTLKGGQKSVGKTTYHHEEAMDQMFKAIELTRMDRRTKSILKLRILGYSFEWMSNYLLKTTKNILGSSVESLKEAEAEGKKLVLQTLQQHSMQDIVGTINAKPKLILGLRNELTNPEAGLS